jgi:hypothetical protein
MYLRLLVILRRNVRQAKARQSLRELQRISALISSLADLVAR